MTVCIAAICHVGPEPKIVLCTDGKGSSPLGSKEWMLKDRILTTQWRCLTAGNEEDLNALVPLFKKNLRALSPIDETNIVPAVRAALQERKHEKADEFTQGKWALSYDDFRKAKHDFPEEQFRSDMLEISLIEIQADCILAGFLDDGIPMLLQTDGKGAVKIREDFAVGGEGAYLAQSGLMHRDHYETFSLEKTLYCVYEAKRYAQRVSSVGEATLLAVYSAGAFPQIVTREGKEYLEEQFKKYGPQKISEPITLDSKLHLTSIEIRAAK